MIFVNARFSAKARPKKGMRFCRLWKLTVWPNSRASTQIECKSDTGGVGLGLAVTRDIIKTHHGSISLSNLKPHGLRVIIELTKSDEAD